MSKTFNMFECFAGIGAQNRALTKIFNNPILIDKLGIKDLEFNIVGTSEWYVQAIIGYDAIHHGDIKDFNPINDEINKYKLSENEEIKGFDELNDKTKYKENIEFLHNFFKQHDYGLSLDSKDPSSFQKIKTLKYDKLVNLYIAMKRNKNYGSIVSLNGNDIVDRVDLLTYSFPCFIAGTLVLTKNGYKKIEDIDENDYVITHTNTYQKVVKPMVNYANHIYKLDSMASETLYVTEEHPFYVRKRVKRWDNKKRESKRLFENPEWIETKNLTKDYYLSIAINQNKKMPIWNGVIDNKFGNKKIVNKLSKYFKEKDFWWLVGVYIGDGWNIINEENNSYRTIICTSKINNQHQELEDKLNKLKISFNKVEERTTYKYHIVWKELVFFLEQFGKYAYGKKLTNTLFDLPIKYLKEFINGYIFSDGYYNKTSKQYQIGTISKELAYGIGQCIAKAYQTPYKINKYKRSETTIIEGREVNQQDSYQINFKLDKRKQDKAFYENGYIWFPMNNLEKIEYNGPVYNMEVENDNSYTVNNIIVHNCTDISNAGKGEGLLSSKRSGLLWEIKRILEELHTSKKLPKFLLMENVKMIKAPKYIEGWNLFQEFLDSIGYKSKLIEINSLEVGIPQSRDRVFCLSEWNGYENEKQYEIEVKNKIKEIESWTSKNKNLIEFLEINQNSNNPEYIKEWKKMIPNNTPSRLEILEASKKLNNMTHCFTITTKADRKPNQGIFLCDNDGKLINTKTNTMGKFIDESKPLDIGVRNRDVILPLEFLKEQHEQPKSAYRYMTPRESLMSMGFRSEDHDLMLKAPFGLAGTDLQVFAGNSIVVNKLEVLFEVILERFMNQDTSKDEIYYESTIKTKEEYEKEHNNKFQSLLNAQNKSSESSEDETNENTIPTEIDI